MEDSDLKSALTTANLPEIVQKVLINGIAKEPDRSETQWVVDMTSPGEQGQLTIYPRKDWEEEERKRKEVAAEAETYEPKGCCTLSGKCRKCNKGKMDHFTVELYCIDSATRGTPKPQAQAKVGEYPGITRQMAKVAPVQDNEGETNAQTAQTTDESEPENDDAGENKKSVVDEEGSLPELVPHIPSPPTSPGTRT